MFAPNPPPQDFWPVFRGVLENGTLVDVYREAPLSFERPEWVPGIFPSFKWRLYFYELVARTGSRNAQSHLMIAFGDYLCRRWNDAPRERGERLRSVEVILMMEQLNDEGRGPLNSSASTCMMISAPLMMVPARACARFA